MKYLVYDEDNLLIRKFHIKEDAIKFLQEGWRLEVIKIPKVKRKDTLQEMIKNLGESPF